MPRKIKPRNVHVVFVQHKCAPELPKDAFVFNGHKLYKARVPLYNQKKEQIKNVYQCKVRAECIFKKVNNYPTCDTGSFYSPGLLGGNAEHVRLDHFGRSLI